MKINTIEEALSESKKCGLSLKDIPRSLMTKDVFKNAVENNGLALGFVPKELRSKDICVEAVKQHGRMMKYIPKKFKDDCRDALLR